MTAFHKEKKLVDNLVEKTLSGKISWSDSPFGDEPWTMIGDHRVSLEEGRSANGSTLIYVVIRDNEHREIDRFHDENLDQTNQSPIYFKILKDLYLTSNRQAKGADKAIDDILKGMDNL